MKEMISDESFAWVVMAEGGFYFHVSKIKNSLIGWHIRPKIEITNNDKDFMLPLLEWLQSKGVSIQLQRKKLSHRQKYWHDNYRIVLQSRDTIHKVLKILLPHLIGKKRKIAIVVLEWLEKFPRPRWRGGLGALNRYKTEACLRKIQERRLEEQKYFLKFMEYHDKIQELNDRHTSNSKYSHKFFSDLWGVF